MNVIAVYPGTFDPITLGHVDVVSRASLMFKTLIVGIAASENKNPLFSLDERVALATEALANLPNVKVRAFSGLLAHTMREWDSGVIIRGLRAISDFEYEVQLAEVNKQIDKDLETVFIAASHKYTFLSSSIVRDIAGHGGNVDDFVPKCVSNAFVEKFN